MKFGAVRDYGHKRSIWMIILCDEAFKYGDGAKFWSYVETNAEPLCRIR
jgi:hypothetical protein